MILVDKQTGMALFPDATRLTDKAAYGPGWRFYGATARTAELIDTPVPQPWKNGVWTWTGQGWTPSPDFLAEVLPGLKKEKIARIDAETSAAILAGFEYAVDGTNYHFSYDTLDQQNFVDAACMCQLALAGTPGLPESVTWNAYAVPTGELVQQTFDAAAFLELYTAGAMAHKAAIMAAGGARKAAVEAAETFEAVEAA